MIQPTLCSGKPLHLPFWTSGDFQKKKKKVQWTLFNRNNSLCEIKKKKWRVSMSSRDKHNGWGDTWNQSHRNRQTETSASELPREEAAQWWKHYLINKYLCQVQSRNINQLSQRCIIMQAQIMYSSDQIWLSYNVVCQLMRAVIRATDYYIHYRLFFRWIGLSIKSRNSCYNSFIVYIIIVYYHVRQRKA